MMWHLQGRTKKDLALLHSSPRRRHQAKVKVFTIECKLQQGGHSIEKTDLESVNQSFTWEAYKHIGNIVNVWSETPQVTVNID